MSKMENKNISTLLEDFDKEVVEKENNEIETSDVKLNEEEVIEEAQVEKSADESKEEEKEEESKEEAEKEEESKEEAEKEEDEEEPKEEEKEEAEKSETLEEEVSLTNKELIGLISTITSSYVNVMQEVNTIKSMLNEITIEKEEINKSHKVSEELADELENLKKSVEESVEEKTEKGVTYVYKTPDNDIEENNEEEVVAKSTEEETEEEVKEEETKKGFNFFEVKNDILNKLSEEANKGSIDRTDIENIRKSYIYAKENRASEKDLELLENYYKTNK